MAEPTILSVARRIADAGHTAPGATVRTVTVDFDLADIEDLRTDVEILTNPRYNPYERGERGGIIAGIGSPEPGDVEERAAAIISDLLAYVSEQGGDVADTMWRAQNHYVEVSGQ